MGRHSWWRHIVWFSKTRRVAIPNENPTQKNDYNLKDETLPDMDGARVAKLVIVLSYS